MSVRPCILIVDDDPRMLRVYRQMFEAAFYVCTTVSADTCNGRFDAFVLDYRLKRGVDPEILKQMRKQGVVAPALVVSGYMPPDQARAMRELGDVTFLSKPVDSPTLIRAVDGMIAVHQV